MIDIAHISKSFRLYHSPADRLREILYRRKFHRVYDALKDISFTVQSGEALGVIGQNGAGKSTLLKLMMGILLPDAGHVAISGRITGLLELTTGFNPEYTGLQNIYLNGILRGMTKAELDEKRDAIIAFSELGDFMYDPLKTYSTGMSMRLAFSIAIHADPLAFVVDEALSVGDAYFQQKCTDRIKSFKSNGGSLVLVSHDMNTVKLLCDKVVLIEQGEILEEGKPETVINAYNYLLARKSAGTAILQRPKSEKGSSYGNFAVEILSVSLLNEHDRDSGTVVSGKKCSIEITLKAHEQVDSLTVGILIRDKFGQDIFGTNTHHLKIPFGIGAHTSRGLRFSFDEFNIGSGNYTLTVAAHTDDVHLHSCYHWVDMIRTFEVIGNTEFYCIGLVRLKPTVTALSISDDVRQHRDNLY
jgi:lipopolysaccharide transport system ATP-binding protein